MMLFMLEQPDFSDCDDAKECNDRFDEIKDCSLTFELLWLCMTQTQTIMSISLSSIRHRRQGLFNYNYYYSIIIPLSNISNSTTN